MVEAKDFEFKTEIGWCPGCGDFGILQSVKKALVDMGRKPSDALVISGIGQAAKLPHYVNVNGFNGLHGRALPAAFGAKSVNPDMPVIVTTGDGDCYGEGGNHFLHNIRRNIDITVVVHNNQIYGLTKGQASPTSDIGMEAALQPGGVQLTPFKPLAVAVTLGAAFVARSISSDIDLTARLIREAVETPGFALIDVMQPCVSFNHLNTYQWYKERAYKLDGDYDPTHPQAAYHKAMEWGDNIPVGVIYKNPQTTYLEKKSGKEKKKLAGKVREPEELEPFLQEFY